MAPLPESSDNVVETEANQIDEGLFLGSALAAEDWEAMQKRNITHVLICHPEMKMLHPDRFIYSRVALPDDPASNLLELLPEALDFLYKARATGGGVFVHCLKGISRSSSCVIALLMMEKGLGFDEAFRWCKIKRPLVYPNVGFQQQLRHFEVLLADAKSAGSHEERLAQLQTRVPRGNLELPDSSLQIRELLSTAMNDALTELQTLLERFSEHAAYADSDEVKRLWQRYGQFFENVQLHRVVPSDASLLQQSRLSAEGLRRFARSRKPDSRGARYADAVAKALELWAADVGPLLGQGKLLLRGEYDSSSESEERGQEERQRSRSPRARNPT